MKRTALTITASVLIAAVIAFAYSIITTAAGNDFVVGQLRVDLSEIYNARDYRATLLANAKPNSGFPDFTTGWFGLDLAQYNGQLYSAQFSQVGLLTNSAGIYWFVYAEPGVTCLRGTAISENRGCQGSSGDLVSIGTWHKVELATYGQGFWIARVGNANGNMYDVAKIWSNSNIIYKAYSTTEEGYTKAQDPYLTASFYHWHPQYMVWGSGFQEWPQSSGNNTSYIWVSDLNGQNTFCPQHYGANPDYANDERAWFAGTGGQQCSWLLFPSVHVYLHLVLKNSP